MQNGLIQWNFANVKNFLGLVACAFRVGRTIRDDKEMTYWILRLHWGVWKETGEWWLCRFAVPTGMILQVVPMLLMVQTPDESRNGCKKPVVPEIEHIDIVVWWYKNGGLEKVSPLKYGKFGYPCWIFQGVNGGIRCQHYLVLPIARRISESSTVLLSSNVCNMLTWVSGVVEDVSITGFRFKGNLKPCT